MHMVLVQFKRYGQDSVTDICVVRDQFAAERYAKEIVQRYPSYKNGEFVFSRIKFIRGV